MKRITIYTDGGARGNPGPAAIGCVITDHDEQKKYTISDYVGIATNNQAEYRALLAALEKAHQIHGTDISVFMDSELIVKQMNGEYRVKDKHLALLFAKAFSLSKSFRTISFSHIPRTLNREADSLVNHALDSRQYKV